MSLRGRGLNLNSELPTVLILGLLCTNTMCSDNIGRVIMYNHVLVDHNYMHIRGIPFKGRRNSSHMSRP